MENVNKQLNRDFLYNLLTETDIPLVNNPKPPIRKNKPTTLKGEMEPEKTKSYDDY